MQWCGFRARVHERNGWEQVADVAGHPRRQVGEVASRPQGSSVGKFHPKVSHGLRCVPRATGSGPRRVIACGRQFQLFAGSADGIDDLGTRGPHLLVPDRAPAGCWLRWPGRCGSAPGGVWLGLHCVVAVGAGLPVAVWCCGGAVGAALRGWGIRWPGRLANRGSGAPPDTATAR